MEKKSLKISKKKSRNYRNEKNGLFSGKNLENF